MLHALRNLDAGQAGATHEGAITDNLERTGQLQVCQSAATAEGGFPNVGQSMPEVDVAQGATAGKRLFANAGDRAWNDQRGVGTAGIESILADGQRRSR